MKKILVVDDKPQIRDLVQAEFEDEGYSVILADGGREAMTKLAELKFAVDLVILDIKMPDVSGLEVLNQIKKQNKDLPVILLSAYPTYKQDFTTWAAEEYVVKSSDLTELKEKVAKFLSA
jgi:CheY-like chemotaxis protein